MIKNIDQYYVRSLWHWIVDRTFYVFAATNLGTIYCWKNKEISTSKLSFENIKLELKYHHTIIGKPEEPTDEFSIIDICSTDIKFVDDSSERNMIFMVAAFEWPKNKHSKCQILMFDRDNDWSNIEFNPLDFLNDSQNYDIIIPSFEWMKTAPVLKTDVTPEIQIEMEESK